MRWRQTRVWETTIGMTRDNDNAYVDLDERSDMANAWGADFFYSIHSDAGSPSKNSTVFLFRVGNNTGKHNLFRACKTTEFHNRTCGSKAFQAFVAFIDV